MRAEKRPRPHPADSDQLTFPWWLSWPLWLVWATRYAWEQLTGRRARRL